MTNLQKIWHDAQCISEVHWPLQNVISKTRWLAAYMLDKPILHYHEIVIFQFSRWRLSTVCASETLHHPAKCCGVGHSYWCRDIAIFHVFIVKYKN